MSINRWMDKENVVHIYSGILLSDKKEQNWVICSGVDEPRVRHMEWSKSGEKQISYIISYIIYQHIWADSHCCTAEINTTIVRQVSSNLKKKAEKKKKEEKWVLLAAWLSEHQVWWFCIFTLPWKISLAQQQASLTWSLQRCSSSGAQVSPLIFLSLDNQDKRVHWAVGCLKHKGPLNVPKYLCYLLYTVHFVKNSLSVFCTRYQVSLPCVKVGELGKFKQARF